MAFDNNVQATLHSNVAIGATTIDVVKAIAPNKDVPIEGRLTLSATNKTEIITYTGRTDNTTYWTLTGVTKDTESSFGDQAWTAGDKCYQALTAADASSFGVNSTTRTIFTATAGQATKTGLDYSIGNIDLYINGLRMTYGTDFTATDGTTITFTPVLSLNDEVQVITDASVPTNIVDAAGGSQADFIASGTLPNGAPIILKADGTVEAVAVDLTLLNPMSIADELSYNSNSGSTYYLSMAFDPNTAGSFVIIYRDSGNADFGTAIVGTVTGSTLSFGSEHVFNTSGVTNSCSIAFDPNTAGKFVVTYQDQGNSNYGMSIVGTISGNTITFGSEYVFNSGNTTYNAIAFDPDTLDKFVVVYKDNGNSYYGTAVIGTLSGTTITFSSESVFNTGNTNYLTIAFDPNTVGKFVVTYQDQGNGYYGTAIVGTIAGSTLSFGTEVVFNTGTTTYITMVFDPSTAGQFVVVYTDQDSTNQGKAIVGTVSGTVITFNTEIVFSSANGSPYAGIAFDPSMPGRFVISYSDPDNSKYCKAVAGSLSGTTITLGAVVVANQVESYSTIISFDPNTANSFVITGQSLVGGNFTGNAVLGVSEEFSVATNLTADNFLGMSTESFSDGQTATVTLHGGLATSQTGLTTNSIYYVQGDGTLATTADTVNVVAGKALTSTSLLLSDAQVPVSVSEPVSSAVGTADFVASGTLPNGSPVILKGDGTVEATGNGTPSVDLSTGSETLFHAQDTSVMFSAYDPHNADKFVVMYADKADSYYGKVVVGTISGNSITFGAAVTYNAAGSTNFSQSLAFDSSNNGKFVVAWDGKARVCTLIGTTISVGTQTTWAGANSAYNSVISDPINPGKFVFLNRDQGVNPFQSKCRVGTISGTTLSYGTSAQFASYANDPVMAFDPLVSGRFIVAYRDVDVELSAARVGTVSGTSISFGSSYTYRATWSSWISIQFDPHTVNRFIIAYAHSYGYVIVGTAIGTTISYGAEVAFKTSSVRYLSAAFDPYKSNTLMLAYEDYSGGRWGTLLLGTLAGTTISYGSPYTFASAASTYVTISFDQNTENNFVVTYLIDDTVDTGAAITGSMPVVGEASNLTGTNFIGVTTDTYTDGQTATVALQGGLVTNQSGLTPGVVYYVQNDGTLSTTPDDPSVEAGKALSPTKLLLKAY